MYQRAYSETLTTLVGVDEAGRGPLAGPVVASAVFLEFDHGIEGLADSKKISSKKREEIFLKLYASAKVHIGVGISTPQLIDQINILQATLVAMQKAVDDLGLEPTLIQIDGIHPIQSKFPVETIIKGDSKVDAISAASIVAKVTRDRIMIEYDKLYPGYGFSKHMGYGTKEHLEAIRKLGPIEIHRKSFAPISSYTTI